MKLFTLASCFYTHEKNYVNPKKNLSSNLWENVTKLRNNHCSYYTPIIYYNISNGDVLI